MIDEIFSPHSLVIQRGGCMRQFVYGKTIIPINLSDHNHFFIEVSKSMNDNFQNS